MSTGYLTGRPLFTVATITYNSGRWIKETIESVLASGFQDFELLICDDRSTDDTAAIVKKYTDPRIVFSQNAENIGEYANRNKALQMARGLYIIYVDGDDVLYRESLLRLSKYVAAFPEAGAVYGVHQHPFEFVIFPFEFTPVQMCSLLYNSLLPISVVGFAETLFKTSALRKAGGFTESFVTGDTYIKRKLACTEKIVLVPMGFCFWRQTPGQATRLASKNYRSMKENFFIDREIIHAGYFPLEGKTREQALLNFRIRTLKLLVKNTLMKGNPFSFVKIFRQYGLPFSDLFLLFKKGKYDFNCDADGATPLRNEYNFIKE